ncbi:hypothetical protein [Pandoravirus japonicus]|uniref:Uncharacterized protein n=1 Tax=Pandoravirus japonicus TaxID=2823154 RepID=A0A811BNT7_9VIRU|nr:hypothetical protein [Pandoravirus japonicus]
MEVTTAGLATTPAVFLRRRLEPSCFVVFSDCRHLFFIIIGWESSLRVVVLKGVCLLLVRAAPVVLFFSVPPFTAPVGIGRRFFLSKDGGAQEDTPTDVARTKRKGPTARALKKKQRLPTQAPRALPVFFCKKKRSFYAISIVCFSFFPPYRQSFV